MSFKTENGGTLSITSSTISPDVMKELAHRMVSDKDEEKKKKSGNNH